jgi:flagellar motility protein MotE (MotC chaperone)
MKNFLILALTALLLFSISAALSLWLNQSREQADAQADKDKAAGKKNGEREREQTEPRAAPKTEPKGDHKTEPGTDNTTFREREAQLARRAAQMDIVLRDLQAQRDVVDNLLKQVQTEMRTASAKVGELEAMAAELEKKKVEAGAAEKQNITRIATMLDTMAPESASKVIVQMSDTGKLDNAARVLVQMKDRQVGRVLDQLDPALAAQLLDKVRAMRPSSPTTAPSPTPGSGTIPAGGVPPRMP